MGLVNCYLNFFSGRSVGPVQSVWCFHLGGYQVLVQVWSQVDGQVLVLV